MTVNVEVLSSQTCECGFLVFHFSNYKDDFQQKLSVKTKFEVCEVFALELGVRSSSKGNR